MEAITSRTWNDAQDISWPNISRYMSLRIAVALMSNMNPHNVSDML